MMGLYKEDVLPFHFQRLQASVPADADQCLVQVQPKRRQILAVQTFALNISLLHYRTLKNILKTVLYNMRMPIKKCGN